MRFVILVCGGRSYGVRKKGLQTFEEVEEDLARVEREGARLVEFLDKLDARRPVTRLVEGEAKGADLLARAWAEAKGIEVAKFPADWRPGGVYDRAAGHKRNARMLAEEKPDLVVAFPGGRGTANMVERARAAGVQVEEVWP